MIRFKEFCIPRRKVTGILLRVAVIFLLLGRAAFGAPEIFVDAKAPAGGDGSEAAPFQKITQGLTAAPTDGATISIRGGRYRETLEITKGGGSTSPLVLRAADATPVEIVGFEALTGWTAEAEGIYRLQTSGRVADLFVGGARQPVARFPKADQPWLKVVASDPNKRTLKLNVLPALTADNAANWLALIYCQSVGYEKWHPVVALDPANKEVTLGASGGTFLPKAGDALIFYNLASSDLQPGEWTCAPEGSGFQVLFRPEKPADLEHTQTRRRKTVIRISGGSASHIRLEGLELSGGSQYGLHASGVSDLTVSRCAIFANGNPTAGLGLRLDDCQDLRIEGCRIFANSLHGLGVRGGANVTVDGCEVMGNDGDGIQFAGGGKEDPLRGVTLKNSYLHHHFFLGHPDNAQIYGQVHEVSFLNNFLLLAGQNMMIQECEEMRFENSVFFGAVSRQVVLGHGTARQATFDHNTFAFATFGAIGTAAEGVRLAANVFYENVLTYESKDIRGEANLFWARREKDPVLIQAANGHKSYQDPKAFAAAHGRETGSLRADPEFQNVPRYQAIGRPTFFQTSLDTIFLSAQDAGAFTIGDTIEVNGEGTPRTVTGVTADAITFQPALPVLPYRNPIVWNWGSNGIGKLNLTSPSSGQAGKPGSTLDVVAFQQGELAGAGRPPLPPLSAGAEEARPRPLVFVSPFYLP